MIVNICCFWIADPLEIGFGFRTVKESSSGRCIGNSFCNLDLYFSIVGFAGMGGVRGRLRGLAGGRLA